MWQEVVGQAGEVLETGHAGDASEATEASGEEDDDGEEEEDEYVIERITDEKTVKGKKMLFVHWQGFEDRTWEPIESVVRAPVYGTCIHPLYVC